jgi:pyruvate formate lyase activating enzyme
VSVVATITTRAAPASRCDESRIAGFVGLTSSAWPGRKSAVILLSGCNMRCSYCFCPELLGHRRSTVSVAEVVARVEGSRGALGGVVVTGGEPTADPGLIRLLRRLHSLHVPTRIDTNGTLPDVLGTVLDEGLASFVALDVKTIPDRYDSVTSSHGAWERVRRSISLLIESGTHHEFRTTCYPSALHTSDLPRMARELEGGRRFVIQQFEPQRTLDPAASTVRPYGADALRRAALCCEVHIPTVVRGA